MSDASVVSWYVGAFNGVIGGLAVAVNVSFDDLRRVNAILGK
jgi:hypothetical protein